MADDVQVPVTMKALVIEDVRERSSFTADRMLTPITVATQRHKVAIKDHPVPAVGEDDVLVKVVAVALNPTDWKRQ